MRPAERNTPAKLDCGMRKVLYDEKACNILIKAPTLTNNFRATLASHTNRLVRRRHIDEIKLRHPQIVAYFDRSRVPSVEHIARRIANCEKLSCKLDQNLSSNALT